VSGTPAAERPLATRISIGRMACWLLDAGLQRLDGGAMFGVVPKPLWERRIAPDEQNRVPLALRCLLVEHPDGLVLVDTGIGNKGSARFRDSYGVENAGEVGPTRLEDAILAAGFRPGDVRWVVNTHLHFDHAGGNTVRRPDGCVEPAFPGASYVLQRGELDFAAHPNERTRASYLPGSFEPIAASARIRLIDGATELLPGVLCLPTPGHVPFHQSVLVSDGGETACFLGDLVPTSAHLQPAWIMGHDLEPLVTLATKKTILASAASEDWLLVFPHDPAVACARVGPGGDTT